MYQALPNNLNFSSKFDTFILAFCPDTCSWFATNERYFYYEYPKKFLSEKDAITFFQQHPAIFYNEEIRMQVNKPPFYVGKVLLENTGETINI